jgi:hypothetical protein
LGHFLRASLLSVGFLGTTEAYADCLKGQQSFTSCQIEGRNTDVLICFDDLVATYRYGPVGGDPDLMLSDTIENVDFEAWSGLGKAIHENVTFYNGEYSYEVGGGFDRPFSEEEMLQGIRRFGWLEIAQNGETLHKLECIPETVTYGFGAGIYDAKVTAGLKWDTSSKTWLPDPSHPNGVPARVPILAKGADRGIIEECMPPAEFELAGIKMGDPAAKLSNLGPSDLSKVVITDILDVERFVFDGLRIDTFQGVVMEIEAKTPKWKMPSGIKVGLTRGEVINILGHVPSGSTATSQSFSSLACMGEQDLYPVWYVVINFGHDKRVETISFASLSP